MAHAQRRWRPPVTHDRRGWRAPPMIASAVQSSGVMPWSMPIWLRNGPGLHAAAPRPGSKSADERHHRAGAGAACAAGVTPARRMRWVNVPLGAPAGRRRSGSSARSFSTPWRSSAGMPANGRPVAGVARRAADARRPSARRPCTGAAAPATPPSVDVPHLADVGVERRASRLDVASAIVGALDLAAVDRGASPSSSSSARSGRGSRRSGARWRAARRGCRRR